MQEPHSGEEYIEVVAEEAELPFILARHWMLLHPMDARAKVIYEILVMHVNVSRGDNAVRATKADIAEMAGFKKPDSIDPYMKALYDGGLATVTKNRTADGLRDRNTYTVRLRPPRGYTGCLSLGEWYRRKKETAGQPVPPSSGVRRKRTNGIPPGGAVPPNSGVRTPEERGPVPPQSGAELDALELDALNPSSSQVVPTGDRRAQEEEEREKWKTKDPLSDDTIIMPTAVVEAPEPETTYTGESSEPDPPAGEIPLDARAVSIVSALDWSDWGDPTEQQLSTLLRPIQRALNIGWAPKPLIAYCNEKIRNAKTRPGTYLIQALTPRSEGGWLKYPEPEQRSRPHTMSPNPSWRDQGPDLDPDTRGSLLASVRKAIEQSRKSKSSASESVSLSG